MNKGVKEKKYKEIKIKPIKGNGSYFILMMRYAKKCPFIFSVLIISSVLEGIFSVFLSISLTSIVASLNIQKYGISHPNMNLSSISDLFDLKIISVNYDPTTQIGKAKFMFINFGYIGWLWMLMVAFLGIMINQYLSTLTSGHFGKRLQVGIRNEAMIKLIKQDISYYSDAKTGELITKVAGDTLIIGEQVEVFTSNILTSLFAFVLGFLFIFLIDFRIGLIILGIIAIISVLILASINVTEKYTIKLRKTITDINSYCADRVASVRLVKVSATEDYEHERVKDIHKKYLKEGKISEVISSSFSTWIWVCVSSIQLITALIVAYFYKTHENLSLLMTSFISVVSILTGPLIVILKIVPDFIKTKTSIRRVNKIINLEPRFEAHYYDGVKIEEIKGNIHFKDIVFAYPEKPEKIILPKFNYTFEQGKSYAFVGTTGSGKSTISRLLLRFYDPTQGKVLINENIDLEDVNLPSYLSKVGYVEQEPQIIYGNVLENIKYSQEWKTNEEAIEACKKAKLHDIIMTWPNKYNTILGERGFMLSGGQKQRLVIARMFLKNPQILILDEATSALDNVVEKEIQQQLNELILGRTTVVIAHRLSTIKDCDKIIVLESGKGIVQEGTFKELVTKEGYFKKLYEAGKRKK